MPKKCTWLVDGMSVIGTVKPQETYKQFFQRVLSFMEPPHISEAVMVGMINDQYPKDSIKEGTRRTRGEGGDKLSISGVDQHMVKGFRWKGILNRSDNKEELIESLARYITSNEGLSSLNYPFIITYKENTFTVSDRTSIRIERCNHEEADTRIVLHAFNTAGDVVVVATDTDILIIMIWVYHTYTIRYKWYLKYKANKYADVSKICTYLGPKLCSNILSLHAISGCDTTSYLYNTGKLKMLSKVIDDPSKADLLKDLGANDYPSENTADSVKEFIRTVLYNDKKSDSYIQTRISKFKRLSNKTSAPLPPDEDSVQQVILRAHLQVFIWRRCTQMIIEDIQYEDYGWKWSEEKEMVVPVWFTGYQFPKDLRSKIKKSVTATNSCNQEADDEYEHDDEDEHASTSKETK